MDPTKRLQVINNADPSLRSVAVPSVASFLQGGANPQASSYNPQPTYNPQQSNYDYRQPYNITSSQGQPTLQVGVAQSQPLYQGSTPITQSDSLRANNTPMTTPTNSSGPINLLRSATNLVSSPITTTTKLVGNANYDLARAGVGALTGNSDAARNAFGAFKRDYQPALSLVQAVPKTVVRLGLSTAPLVTGGKGPDVYNESFQPKGLQKVALGSDPIPTYQKAYQQNKAQHGANYARALSTIQAISDAAVVYGGAKAASSAAEKTAATNKVISGFQQIQDPEAAKFVLTQGMGLPDDAITQQAADELAAHSSKIEIARTLSALQRGTIVSPAAPLATSTALETTNPALAAETAPVSSNALALPASTFTPAETQVLQSAGISNPGVAPIPTTTPTAPTAPASLQVNSQPNPELVKEGLTSGQIVSTPISNLQIGSDSLGETDPKTVQQYVDMIRAGKPIDPVIVTNENGQLFVQDGAHRLEAMRQLGITDIPTVEKGTGKPTPEAQVAQAAQQVTAPSVEPQQEALTNQVTAETANQGIAPTTSPNEAASPQAVANEVNKNADKAAGLTNKEANQLRKDGYDEKLIQQMHEAAGGTGVPGETAKAPPSKTAPATNPDATPMIEEGRINRLTSRQSRLQHLAEKGDTSAAEALQMLRSTDVTKRMAEQDFVSRVPTFKSLSKSNQSQAIDILEGNAPPTTDPKITQAVAELRDFYKYIHTVSTNNGIQVGDLGDNYFNHNFPRGYFDNKKNFNEAVNHLIKTGQAAGPEEAIAQLNNYLGRAHVPGTPTAGQFGNFKARGLDLPGYNKNYQAVADYARGAAEANAHAIHLGPNGENVKDLLLRSVQNNNNTGAIRDIIDSYLHPETAGSGTGSKLISAYQKGLRFLQLPKAAVSHLPQSFANTTADTGYINWSKGVGSSLINQDTRQFWKDAGLNSGMSGHGPTIFDKGTAPGLMPVLRASRIVSAEAGRNVALGMAEKGDIAGLRGMGVTGDFAQTAEGKISLTPRQQAEAGFFQADQDIGSHSLLEEPTWSRTNVGKTFGQYLQSYVFKQSERIARMAREARGGNYGPLLRYLAVSLPVSGVVLTAIKNETKHPGKSPIGDKGAGSFALDSLENSGGLSIGYGAARKVVDAARYNYNTDARYRNAASAVAAPAGFAVETGQNIDKAARGNAKPGERQGLKTIPLVGNFLSNKLVPSTPFTSTGGSKIDKNGNVVQQNSSGNPLTDYLSNQGTSTIKNEQDFLTGLSKQDQQYFYAPVNGKVGNPKKGDKPNVTQSDLDKAHQAGIINDADYAYASGLQKAYSNAKNENAPDKLQPGVDDLASRYLEKTSKLTPAAKAKYMNGPPDQNAKDIAAELNKNLPAGINPVQPSNKVSDLYASFQKAQQKAKDDGQPWDDFEQRSKARTLWKNIATEGVPELTQDIYKQPITQLKDYFVKNKKVTNQDLMNAIAFDDALYNADLIDTPHFSKSFRKNLGVGMPAGSGGSGSGGSSGSGSGATGGRSNTPGNFFQTKNGLYGTVQGETGPKSGYIDPNTGLFINQSQGISQLLAAPTALKKSTIAGPGVNLKPTAAPKLKNFAAPNVRGAPLQQRAVPIRYERIKFEK